MGIYESDGFFDVTVNTHETSQGPVQLPILYFDTSNVMAFFLGRATAVKSLLQGTGLKPALTLGRLAVVGLSFYEYRKTTVGEYNEVGLAIPVLPEGTAAPLAGLTDLYRDIGSREMGFHVLDLPVTTERANAAGRELWGYPKFVTDIVFSLDDDHFHGKVLDPDERQMILSLDGALGVGVTVPPLSPITYSRLGDSLLKTCVNVRGPVKLSHPWSMRLCVGSSSHPMATRLRLLGLEDARVLALMSTHQFQSRLNEGEAT
jgi:hypothetical protein